MRVQKHPDCCVQWGIISKFDSLADELKFIPITGRAMSLSSRDDGGAAGRSGIWLLGKSILFSSRSSSQASCPRSWRKIILDNLSPHLPAALKEAAQARGRPHTQLHLLNLQTCVRLIKEATNTFWPGREAIFQWFDEDKSDPPASWLKMVWKNLCTRFAENVNLMTCPLSPELH